MSTKLQGCTAQHNTTPETKADPCTETPLPDRIEDLANDVAYMACFSSRKEHAMAEMAAARDPQESFATSCLMRLAQREMHGKPAAEQQKIEQWYRNLWEQPPLDVDGYLDGTCKEFFAHWTPAIRRAQALAMDLAKQKQTVRVPLDVIREALVPVLFVARNGQTFLDECDRTVAINEFTPNQTREELFRHAGGFAELLREQGTKARLLQVADTLRVYHVLPVKPKRIKEKLRKRPAGRMESGPSEKPDGVQNATGGILVKRDNVIKLPAHCKPMTTTGLAVIFGCSANTILRCIKSGKLAATPYGRKWSVPIDALPAEYVQKAIQK